MIMTTVKADEKENAAIVEGERKILISTINEFEGMNWSIDLLKILQGNQLEEIKSWYQKEGQKKLKTLSVVEGEAFSPLYRKPGKIWGVGLNYLEKAIEMTGKAPEEEPVIFMKPDTSLIGHNDAIKLPFGSNEVTAEAELALIIGKTCKNVSEEKALDFVAGYSTSMDMTARDIHAKNPRYLQRAKSFDTFFSFGPYFLTKDEIPDLKKLSVQTILNGKVIHQNVVENMMYQPAWIVSFFSQVMTLNPGDIIMTGTPGSVIVREGDMVGCNIKGFHSLLHPVKF